MERPHVIRVGQTEIFIEPVAERQELRRIAQMPFAEDRGGIAALFDAVRPESFRWR